MLETLLKQARQVLEDNWNGNFTEPGSAGRSCELSWDAGFSAIGNAHFNMDRAEATLRHLFGAQWGNGMLPLAVWGDENAPYSFPGAGSLQFESPVGAPSFLRTTGITAPPVFGFVLWRIYEIAQDEKRARAFLREMYPKVLALHRFLYNCRDPLEEGLVYICHPWESPGGHSPLWDNALQRIGPAEPSVLPPGELPPGLYRQDYSRYLHLIRILHSLDYNSRAIFEKSPFLIQDPLFNGILAWSNECLIRIGGLLGEDVSEPVQWDELAKYSMNEKLWDESRGIYNAFDLRSNEHIPAHTIAGLMPLAGDAPTQEQAEKMLKNLEGEMFGGNRKGRYLCPSHGMPGQDGGGIGPVYIPFNWILAHGLERYEMYGMAERIRRDSLELLNRYGLFGCFSQQEEEPPLATPEGSAGSSAAAAIYIDFLPDE